MYSLMKKIITEKDIRRHVSLVEQLLNHTKITVNELAEIIGTTERTIFLTFNLFALSCPKAGTSSAIKQESVCKTIKIY